MIICQKYQCDKGFVNWGSFRQAHHSNTLLNYFHSRRAFGQKNLYIEFNHTPQVYRHYDIQIQTCQYVIKSGYSTRRLKDNICNNFVVVFFNVNDEWLRSNFPDG